MPSVEISKLQGISPARALSESDRAPSPPHAVNAAAPSLAKPGLAVEVDPALAGGVTNPPIDTDRVEQIRAALRDGTYPLVPVRTADAMIAAQVSFADARQGGQ
jgi:negative regulator of flagellin synthesis FlgM